MPRAVAKIVPPYESYEIKNVFPFVSGFGQRNDVPLPERNNK